MKQRKRNKKSLAGKTSLRGSGCLSAKDAGMTMKRASQIEGFDLRELNWCERLKRDMERAELYFWQQTAERQVIFCNFLAAGQRIWRGNEFCFGKKA